MKTNGFFEKIRLFFEKRVRKKYIESFFGPFFKKKNAKRLVFLKKAEKKKKKKKKN
jgi:hypothetical protein